MGYNPIELSPGRREVNHQAFPGRMHGTFVSGYLNRSWLAVEFMHGTFVQPVPLKRRWETQPRPKCCLKIPLPLLSTVAESQTLVCTTNPLFQHSSTRRLFTLTYPLYPIIYNTRLPTLSASYNDD